MGFLTNNFIADFFATVLNAIYSLIGSYGWSIVLLTIIIRILLLPLDIKQKKNTRKQKLLQPKVDAIKRKYANDKEMQSKKTMELYKEENFSMFSGCLPMLLQMPILFAFFGAMSIIAGEQILAIYEAAKTLPPESIQIESWFWVKNIWQPDVFLLVDNFPKNTSVIPLFEQISQRYQVIKNANITDFDAVLAPVRAIYAGVMNGWFILPLLAGGMSFLQSKITMPAQPAQPQPNEPANPMSGKMMQYLFPVMSIVICVSASAAFALYWSISSMVGVVSSVVIEKVLTAKENQNA